MNEHEKALYCGQQRASDGLPARPAVTDDQIREAISGCFGHDTDSTDVEDAIRQIRALFQ